MSKVIHLADSAHVLAKTYCKEHGLKMSDWVASLIGAAVRDVAREETAVSAPAVVVEQEPAVRKKRLPTFEADAVLQVEDNTDKLSRPPFWAPQQAQVLPPEDAELAPDGGAV